MSLNDDLQTKDREELLQEVIALRASIRQHMNEKGHDRCWLDDGELYSILPEKDQSVKALPPKEEFLTNCNRYWSCRQAPEDKKAGSWNNEICHIAVMSIASGPMLIGVLFYAIEKLFLYTVPTYSTIPLMLLAFAISFFIRYKSSKICCP